MKVFLSHARKDQQSARQLAQRLQEAGFTVWKAEEEIVPGDNWAKKTGKALDEAEFMVVLLTPGAMESDALRQDIEFALGSKKFEDRFLSVFLGPTIQSPKDVPWILLRLPHEQVGSTREFSRVVKRIDQMRADSRLSHAHA